MKKLLCIFIFIVLSLFIISCKKDDVNNEDDNDNSKIDDVNNEDDNDNSRIDDDNSEDDNNNYKTIIKYRSIINMDPYEYVYAFYSIDGEKIGASYEDASDFYKGYASVKLKNSREYFLIDENGKRVTSDMYSVETIKGNYDYPYVYKIKNFTEEDYKYRYALGNYKGKALTEFKYLDIVAKADVYFAYTIDNEYKKCFDVLTKDGKTLLKDIENDLIVTDSFIIYYKNNYDNTDFTIYNKSGTELSKYNVKTKDRASNIDIREISNEYLGICIKLKNTVNNLYYVSNLKGEDVMPEYSFISYEKENDILTLNDKNDSSIYKYFNSKLEPYLNDKDIIYYIGNDFLAVRKDDLAYCYNKNGDSLIDKGFNEIYFAKNLIECFLDGEGFIYDLKGNLLFQYPLSINYLFYYDIDNDKLFCYVVQSDNLIFYEVNNGVATEILTTQKAACGIYKNYLVLYSDRNKVYNLLTKELILELEKGYSSSFPVDSFCFFSAAKDNHYIYYNDKFEEILNINVNNDEEHVHTVDTKWSYDDDSHWHDLTCEHRGDIKNDVQNHELTEDDYGLLTCSVCGYTREFDIEVNYDGHPVDLSNPVVLEIYQYEKHNIFVNDKSGGDVKLVADDPAICYATKYYIKGLEVGSTVLYPYYKSLKLDYPIYVNVIKFSVDTSKNDIDDVNTLNKLNEDYIIRSNNYSVDIKGKDITQEEYKVNNVYQVRKEPYYYYKKLYHEAGDTITIYKEEDGFKYYHYAVSFYEDGEINISRMIKKEISFQPELYYPTGYFDFSFDNMEVERDGNKYKIKGYASDLSDDMRKYINLIFEYSYNLGYFTGTIEIKNNVISFNYVFWFINTHDNRLSCEMSYTIDLNPFEEYDLSDFYTKEPTSIYEVTQTTIIGENIDIQDDGDFTYCKSYFEKGIYYLDVSSSKGEIDYSVHSLALYDHNYLDLANNNNVFYYKWRPLDLMFEIKEDGYYYYRIGSNHNEDETIKIKKYEDGFHEELKLGNNVGTIRDTFDSYLFKQEITSSTKYNITNNKNEPVYICSLMGFTEIAGNSNAVITCVDSGDVYIYVISPFSGINENDSYSFDIDIEILD